MVSNENDQPACPTCGYALNGLVSPTCPECGIGVVVAPSSDRPVLAPMQYVASTSMQCRACGLFSNGIMPRRCRGCGKRFTWRDRVVGAPQVQC